MKKVAPKFRDDKSFFLLFFLGIAAFVLCITISANWNIPFGILSKDPLSASDFPPYYGLLSNMGIIFWNISLGCCVFALTLKQTTLDPVRRGFLLFSGLLCLILMLDDFFMIHDKIIPYFLGIHEIYIYLLYLFLVIYYIIRFWDLHKSLRYKFLVAAFIFFSLSLITDHFDIEIENYLGKGMRYILEDGFKFFGIIFWTGYFMSFSALINPLNANTR